MIALSTRVFLLYFLWNEAFEKETNFTNNHIKFNGTVIGLASAGSTVHFI